jgi:hypothetical protein
MEKIDMEMKSQKYGDEIAQRYGGQFAKIWR